MLFFQVTGALSTASANAGNMRRAFYLVQNGCPHKDHKTRMAYSSASSKSDLQVYTPLLRIYRFVCALYELNTSAKSEQWNPHIPTLRSDEFMRELDAIETTSTTRRRVDPDMDHMEDCLRDGFVGPPKKRED